MTVEEILKRPYHWVVIPEDDGSFFGTIAEFPGCITVGATPAETIENLAEVADSWLHAVIYMGQSIPEPKPNVHCPRTGLSI